MTCNILHFPKMKLHFFQAIFQITHSHMHTWMCISFENNKKKTAALLWKMCEWKLCWLNIVGKRQHHSQFPAFFHLSRWQVRHKHEITRIKLIFFRLLFGWLSQSVSWVCHPQAHSALYLFSIKSHPCVLAEN